MCFADYKLNSSGDEDLRCELKKHYKMKVIVLGASGSLVINYLKNYQMI